jgi:hypothetical protein
MANEEVFTTFLPQSKAKNFAPFYDSQRVYSNEHNLIIYGHSAGGHGRTFQVLDVPQRRWYEFNIPSTPSSLWPPPSLSEAEEKELGNRFTQHVQNQQDIFNTITLNARGDATYEIKPSVGLPLRKQPILCSSTFPTAKFVEVTEKTYLHHAVDMCTWNGARCIYKQLRFDSMIETLLREISSREKLMHYFGETDPSLLSRHGINPILAIVVDGNPPLLHGILLAFAGLSLDKLSGRQITIQHFASLIETVVHLRAAEVEHGDICDRNVCLEGSSIQLIDFGEKAPEYTNDVAATGHLMLLCVSRMSVREDQEAVICKAASALIELEDLNSALTILQNAHLNRVMKRKL